MKLFNQSVAFFMLTCSSLYCSVVEAKSIEFLLDHKTSSSLILEPMTPNHSNQVSLPAGYTQRVKLENIGDNIINNCFPYVNIPSPISLDHLASRLAEEANPLLALYQLWNQSLIKDDASPSIDCHPLDLLNFKVRCSEKTFTKQFISLCQMLGIEVRMAHVHGKTGYDFGYDDEWVFLDLANQQRYISLTNERLVSSEEIMDDPFLALRTKHPRRVRKIDFKHCWQQLANFEILDPIASNPPLEMCSDLPEERTPGLTIYPGESVTFESSAVNPTIGAQECYIEQTLDIKKRRISLSDTLTSSFPIQKIVNQSTEAIYLIDEKIAVQPGEEVILSNPDCFEIKIAVDHEASGQLIVSGIANAALFPALVSNENKVELGIEKNDSIVRIVYELDEKLEDKSVPTVSIINESHTFDYQTPYFHLQASEEMEKIWWQIGLDPEFQVVPSNFDQEEPYVQTITLPSISETFLNKGNTYYFRIKGSSKGQWGDWSPTFLFTVDKPEAVLEVEFTQINDKEYELNWDRYAEDSDEKIDYLVFGSNSLDFIPSVYCATQINAIVNDVVTEEEVNDNLVAITSDTSILVDGGLAYYRIIARSREQLSVPSSLIHVYDHDLVQPRNVLQVVEDAHEKLMRRTLLPPSYPWTEISLPKVNTSSTITLSQSPLFKLQSVLRGIKKSNKKYPYEFPDVSEEIWNEVRQYLLPPNHPAWPKLNRIFGKSRATLNSDAFKKAGFSRWRPGRWSRVSASSHPECKEYFIKAYCDSELGIIYDWKKWIHRIKGAETIRECIREYDLQKDFKVPHKWIYPLPKNPSPPDSSRYIRKNFILVTENMRLEEHKRNEKLYKTKMTKQLMSGLYTILQVCGLYDSVYVFNIPFCKDGRLAVIDTEYHHKWPVPFHKLTSKFSKDLQTYWKNLTFNGGKIPNGVSQSNPPRMDRRDVHN